MTDENTNYMVRSVTRALDVLIELSRNEGPMQLVPLARRLNLHPSTTLRMLASLRARGMVRLVDQRLYDLGPMTLKLGKSFISFLEPVSITWHPVPGESLYWREISNLAILLRST